MPGVGMDEEHRQAIICNISWLIKHTDIDILIPKLVEKGVFTTSMVEKFRENAHPSQIRKADFYIALTKRGPTAFRKLIESFMETGHFEAAQQLDPNQDVSSHLLQRTDIQDSISNGNGAIGGHSTIPICLPQYMVDENPNLQSILHNAAINNPNDNIRWGTEPLKVKVQMATTRMDTIPLKGNLKVYPMKSRPKGYFLMINNVEFMNDIEERRKGAEVDERNLRQLFEGLGYEVIAYRNQGFIEMKMKIEAFAQKEEHKNVDSCVVAILSHGRSGKEVGSTDIVASDGQQLSTETVIEYFDNYHCPHLAQKPKIFIFQTCRGEKEAYGVKIEPRRQSRFATDGYPMNRMRMHSDILVAYPTLPGYVSIRDKCLGTWFISALCKIFMEYAKDTDIQDMLIMVDESLKNLRTEDEVMQTSSFENRGFHKFYFNPGLYEDDVPETMDSRLSVVD